MLEEFLGQAAVATEPKAARKVVFSGVMIDNGMLRLNATTLEGEPLQWGEPLVNATNAEMIMAHYRTLIAEMTEVKEDEWRRGVAVAQCKYDLSRLRSFPYAHQVIGLEALVKRSYFALFDEMGAGKTKQTIDALMILYLAGLIDRVVVLAPGGNRDVWADQTLGELAKHLWADVPVRVKVFHSKNKEWLHGPVTKNGSMTIVCSNYEFIRSKARLNQLLPFCNEKTVLVLDESWAIKNYKAVQTKATRQLRNKCGRVVLLNGTPVANTPLDLFSQGFIMHPGILECKTLFEYRARYAIMGGWQQKEIKGWRDLPDVQRRFAPYVLRRLKKDCLDLPEKLPPEIRYVPLSDDTWAIYKQMRDELVVWFGSNVVTAQQAIVKVMRLAQITSGFIGGVESSGLERQQDLYERPAYVPNFGINDIVPQEPQQLELIREISREKLDDVLAWWAEQLAADPLAKIILNFRFRPELARFEREFSAAYPEVPLGLIQGSQTRDRYKTIDGQLVLIQRGERGDAIRLLDPRTAHKDKPSLVAGITKTGSTGYNFAAAKHVGYVSHDPSLFVRKQSEDRAHRPGQVHNVGYTEWCATGPDGQRTIDHVLLAGLRKKEEVAEYTTSAWVQSLQEE